MARQAFLLIVFEVCKMLKFFLFKEAMAFVLNETEQSKRKWDQYEDAKQKTIARSLQM